MLVVSGKNEHEKYRSGGRHRYSAANRRAQPSAACAGWGAAASFRDGHFDMQNMRKVSFVRFADFRVSAEMGTLSSHRGALGN